MDPRGVCSGTQVEGTVESGSNITPQLTIDGLKRHTFTEIQCMISYDKLRSIPLEPFTKNAVTEGSRVLIRSRRETITAGEYLWQ